MERQRLETQRMQAYVEVREAEEALLANKNALAHSRYKQALDRLSRIERTWTQLADIQVPLEMGQ